MRTNRKFITFLLTLSVIIPMAACSSRGHSDQISSASGMSRQDQINAAIERAQTAKLDPRTKENLIYLERKYRKSDGNADDALKYAHALRKADRLSRASMIISPFAYDEDEKSSDIKTEFAAIQAAMGNYKDAEDFAREAVLLEPEKGQAYHVLGIALDAQGYHQQAEVALRKGLDLWGDNPGPILNNLGLNLAAQGFLDEAVDTLRKAVAISPGRLEIERNLRIVSTLQKEVPGAKIN